MSSTSNCRYLIYRDAATIVRSGWVRGQYSDGKGSQCLVQSVLTSSGILRSHVLPNDMVAEIDDYLVRFASYRVLREAHLVKGLRIQDAIMAWNDLPWRRPSAVIGVLEGIASTLAEQEIARLSAEIVKLKSKIEELKARVTQLEAENISLRKRLANYLTLRHERTELQALSDQLDRTWNELVEARG